MNRILISAFLISAFCFLSSGCASVHYTERPDGSREFRSTSLAKDVSATHKTPTSETVISSSSVEATHTVGNLASAALGALAGGAVAGPAGAGVGAVSSGTLAELWQTLQDRLAKPTTNAPAIPPVVSVPSVPSVPPAFTTIWPAHVALDFFDRGAAQWEIDRRAAYVAAARAAGLDCIRFGTHKVFSVEERYHNLHYASRERPEYYLTRDDIMTGGGDSWWTFLNNRGITRLQMLWDGNNGADWADAVRSHTAADLQVLCAPAHVAAARELFPQLTVISL